MRTISNKNGDIITSDFIVGKFDATRVNEIISNDTTPLPAGYPKLWFNIYANKISITNLLGLTLQEYDI